MSESKLRIPRVATAVMVLGGLSCGGDGGGGGGDRVGRDGPDSPGTNASTSRIAKLASQTCKLESTCEDGPFAESEDEFDTQQECVDSFVAELSQSLATQSKKCADAYLDYYECYIGHGCEPDEDRCEKLYTAVEQACPNLGDNDDDE